MRIRRTLLPVLALAVFVDARAQQLSQRPAPPVAPVTSAPLPANSDPTYLALRRVVTSGQNSSVSNLTLKRDAGTFTFHSGTFYFLAPVNGKVTGAIFIGDGSFSLVPPSENEKISLKRLTKQDVMEETFQDAVFRFTDGTDDEITKAAGTGSSAPFNGGYFDDVRNDLKKQLHYNLDGRILEDVLSDQPGGLFVAFIKGKNYSGKMIYVIDPHGVDNYVPPVVAPEEVALITYGVNKVGIWAAFHTSSEIAAGTDLSTQRNGVVHIVHQKLDTQIEKSANLNGDATTSFISQTEGLRVVPLNLFPSLRVKSVTDASGQSLAFIQEDKKEDADFYVILSKPLHKGDTATIRTIYGGVDAVKNEGGGNYFPVARDDWYPNTQFGDYATYEMTFRIPKGMNMVATGDLQEDVQEGSEDVSKWKSDTPLAVGGFNFGRFKKNEVKLDPINYTVSSFANEDQPDILKQIQLSGNPTLGSMSTTSLAKKALAEGQLSVMIYSDYYGPSSYHQLAMTQQTAFGFGQSWPELVYLPFTSFLDETVRHQFGISNIETHNFWMVVAPHEVAHQWWGHTVGIASYRDNWLSEGFADFSAALFLQNAYGKEGTQKYIQFWNDERELLTQKDAQGFRAIDAGPVTMGYRAGNSKTGFSVGRALLYPKGAYILQMIRMMMFNARGGDAAFKEMMHDYTDTYRNQPASTENFKSILEKHMTREMDLDGNHKMDWFFNSYVYGTALPSYKLESSFDKDETGVVLNLKITQSNVDSNFKMLVPIYLELANGNIVPLGRAHIKGSNTLQQKVPLGHIQDVPKRAILSYLNDVLCSKD